MYNKRVPSGQDPRLLGKVKQTTCIIYDMPKDYNNIMCIYIYITACLYGHLIMRTFTSDGLHVVYVYKTYKVIKLY